MIGSAKANDELVSVPEVALAKQWRYQRAYDAVLRGSFGLPVRVDGRLFVRREAVESDRAR